MTLLHGLTAPEGRGDVVEVHLDMQNPTPAFQAWLYSLGFQDDPFERFFPKNYTDHATGRTRALPKQPAGSDDANRELRVVLPEIRALVDVVVAEAQFQGILLYAEVEIVRGKVSIPLNAPRAFDSPLDSLNFAKTGKFGGALADIHVKFAAGAVPEEVRSYLLSKHFYWVSIAANSASPAKEVATLQTAELGSAMEVYRLLLESPLPSCNAIQLEQKLAMKPTALGIPMPEVICVTSCQA
jgi:hypothetical protein